MAEQNNEKIITTDTLYTFKLEQDLQNLEKFKLKNDSTDLKGAVRYDAAQVLEDTQKQQARANIGAADESVVIRFDKAQDPTPEEKAQARANIGAGTGDGTGSGVSDYDELLNRPIYDDRVISNYSYEENPNPVSFDCAAIGYSFHKVSDLVLTKEEMFNANITINDRTREKFSQDNVLLATDQFLMVQYPNNGFAFCLCNTVGTCDVTFMGNSFSVDVPEVGIYAANALGQGMPNISTIEIFVSGELKQLDDKYIPNNIARLNESGLIPAEKLPSYVDDVVEGYYSENVNIFYEGFLTDDGGLETTGQISPETGKIYVDLYTGNTYRWSGSQYVRMNPPEYTLASNEDIYALFNK